MSEKKRVCIDQYEFIPHGSSYLIRGIDYLTGQNYQSEELINYNPQSGERPESRNHVYDLLHAKGEPEEADSSKLSNIAPDVSVDKDVEQSTDATKDQSE